MLKIIFVLFCFVGFFLNSYAAFCCKKVFTKVENLTAKEVRELDTETIQNLPAEEVQKLAEDQIRLLSAEQFASLPFRHFLPSQVYAFKRRINDLIKNQQELENDPKVSSLLIRINIRDIYPAHIPLIPVKYIRMWTPADIKKLKGDQISAFSPEQIQSFGKLVEHFLPEQIQAFGENIKHFLPEQFEVFSFKQGSALTMRQLAVLDKEQFHSIEYTRTYLYL